MKFSINIIGYTLDFSLVKTNPTKTTDATKTIKNKEINNFQYFVTSTNTLNNKMLYRYNGKQVFFLSNHRWVKSTLNAFGIDVIEKMKGFRFISYQEARELYPNASID